jgi:hypothetical protein
MTIFNKKGIHGQSLLLCGLIIFMIAGVTHAAGEAPYYTFPSSQTLCGETIPLEERSIWERMDREFTLNVNDRGQIYLWLKRSRRYFPFIEARLKEKGLPDDLKYLMVAESSILSRAVSNKGAAGFWQFMERTGKRFNLQKKSHIDERYDLAKATDAAIAYLKFLYDIFGKWTLAMAAYNCGEERVREEISQQGENDYFRLALPQETERYIFRILSAKLILGDPQFYGFNLPENEGYPPLEYDQVTLQLSQPLPLRELAKACGSYFKELKEFNPELQGYVLPPGSHTLKIPSGKRALLEKSHRDWIKNNP